MKKLSHGFNLQVNWITERLITQLLLEGGIKNFPLGLVKLVGRERE